MNVMFPTSHSMSVIRQCLEITNWSTREGKLSINRAWYQNPKYFWDGMVKDTQRLLKIGALVGSLYYQMRLALKGFAFSNLHMRIMLPLLPLKVSVPF